MRRVMFGCLMLWLSGSCLGQTLCPKHIEMPIYPRLARAARIQGKVTLKVLIDAEGKVKNAEVTNVHQIALILQESAIDNVQRWTFEKPTTAPVTQVIVYQYQFDGTLPVNRQNYPVTKVNLDLPDRVTILTNELVINPSKSKKEKMRSHLL